MEERAIIKQRGKWLFIPLDGKMLDDYCKTCDERGDYVAAAVNCNRNAIAIAGAAAAAAGCWCCCVLLYIRVLSNPIFLQKSPNLQVFLVLF